MLERHGVDDVASVFRALVANRAVHVPGFSADGLVDRLQRAWDVEPGSSKTAIVSEAAAISWPPFAYLVPGVRHPSRRARSQRCRARKHGAGSDLAVDPPAFPVYAAVLASMTRLRIATYNLDSLGNRPGRPPLAARLGPLRSALAALDADVLCLQEIDGAHPAPNQPRRLLALEELVRGTPYERFTLVASHRPEGGAADVHNLAILTRCPVLSSAQLWNDIVRAPTFDRPLLHAVLETGGRRLHVVDLHLRAPLGSPVPGGKLGKHWRSASAWAEGFFLAGVKRTAQALEARSLVDRLLDEDPDAAIVVAGDFNCDEREVPYRILRAALDDTDSPELADRELCPVAATVPPEARFTVLHAGHPRLVDHLLLSRTLAVQLRGAWIRNDALPDEASAPPESVRASTHAPVVAEIDI